MLAFGIYTYISLGMTNDKGLYIKIPEKLKKHATKFAKDRGGVSKLIRDLLIKETKFKEG